MTLDELLSSAQGGGKGKGRFERKETTIPGWAGRRDNNGHAEILVWLHTKSEFYTLYQHRWPRIGRQRNNPEAQELYFGNFRCFESEFVCKKQSFHDRATGKREYPPEVCPFCRLIEHVRDLVAEGKLDPTDELFVFNVGGTKTVIHAGGVYGFRGEDEGRVRAAGITKPWQESLVGRKKFVLSLVDNSSPDTGPQVVTAPETLGKAVIATITGLRRTAGSAGDPLVNPYPFLLTYDDNAPGTSKYGASAVPMVKLTDQVKRQITESEPGDVTRVFEPWNVRSIWANMEQACVQNCIDWDYVFSPAIAKCDPNGTYTGDKDLPGAPKPNGNGHMTSLGKETIPSGASPEDFCTRCHAYMAPDSLTCTGCGTKYEAADEDSIPF